MCGGNTETMDEFAAVVTGVQDTNETSNKSQKINCSTEWVPEVTRKYHGNCEHTSGEKNKTHVPGKEVFKFFSAVQAQHPQETDYQNREDAPEPQSRVEPTRCLNNLVFFQATINFKHHATG